MNSCVNAPLFFLSVLVHIMFVFVNNKVLPDMHIKCLAEWQVRNFVVQVNVGFDISNKW